MDFLQQDIKNYKWYKRKADSLFLKYVNGDISEFEYQCFSKKLSETYNIIQNCSSPIKYINNTITVF